MKSNNKGVFVFIIVALVAVAAYAVLTMPDQRTTGQKVGDAVDELPRNPGRAVEQLGDRTPGERLGDAVKDAGQDIKDNTNRD